jgi:hypothetical protein
MDFLDAYMERRQAELEELDSELKTIEFRVSDAPADRQIQLYDDLQALRVQYGKTRQKLGEMRKASGRRRDELKDELETGWKELQNGMQRAQQSLR